MKKGEDLEDRVVLYLRRAAEVRGHGVLGAGQKSAGVSTGYLRATNPYGVGMGKARAIAEGCGLNGRDTFVFGMDDGAASRLVADGRRLSPKPKDLPPPIRGTVHRMRHWWREDRAGHDLGALDDLRYEDAPAARQAIELAMKQVSGPRTYTRVLGMWGSAQRMLYRLDWSTVAIGLAIESARAASDRELLVEEMQRGIYVLLGRGELDWMVDLAAEGLSLRAQLRERGALGRGLMSFGIALFNAGEAGAARYFLEASLGLLGEDHARMRFAVHQNLALSYESLEDYGAASEALERAISCVPDEAFSNGKLAWAEGRIKCAQGDLAGSESAYRRALGHSIESPCDAALVGAELVRVVLRRGKLREANRLAKDLTYVVDKLAEHPMDMGQMLSAALYDLSWAGIEAKVSLALVDGVLERLAKGRAAATAHLREHLRF